MQCEIIVGTKQLEQSPQIGDMMAELYANNIITSRTVIQEPKHCRVVAHKYTCEIPDEDLMWFGMKFPYFENYLAGYQKQRYRQRDQRR